jgi:hypothetical protein
MGKRSRVMKAGDGVYRQNGVTYEGTIHNIEPRQPTFIDNVWGFSDNIGKGIYNAAATTVDGVKNVATNIGTGVTNTVGVIIPQSYKVGDKVQAQFINSYGKPTGKWYRAEITYLYDDGKYGVKYYDDNMEAILEKQYIKRGGKSRKQRKSHKNNKSRKNRKSRKERK